MKRIISVKKGYGEGSVEYYTDKPMQHAHHQEQVHRIELNNYGDYRAWVCTDTYTQEWQIDSYDTTTVRREVKA